MSFQQEDYNKFACFGSYFIYSTQKDPTCLNCTNFIECMQKIIEKQHKALETGKMRLKSKIKFCEGEIKRIYDLKPFRVQYNKLINDLDNEKRWLKEILKGFE